MKDFYYSYTKNALKDMSRDTMNCICNYSFSHCLTRILLMVTLFLNLIQYDAKLATLQVKSKSNPDSTALAHSIYKKVCEFSFQLLLRKILLLSISIILYYFLNTVFMNISVFLKMYHTIRKTLDLNDFLNNFSLVNISSLRH